VPAAPETADPALVAAVRDKAKAYQARMAEVDARAAARHDSFK
jgi:hypothetical protein